MQRRAVHIPEGKAWTIEYARTLLQVWKLEDEATTPLPSLDILFGNEGGSFRKLDRASQYCRKLQKRLQEFEKEHGTEIGLSATGLPARWKPGDAPFREAYRLLRLVEVENLQRQVETQVHELLYLQSCASKLGDRPGDLKKVRKEMERGRSRIRTALARLTEWKRGLDETVLFGGENGLAGEGSGGFVRRRSGVEQGVATGAVTDAEGFEEFRLDSILKGDFPWLDEATEAGMQGSVGLRLKRKLESLEEDKRRGEEEKALVKLEMERALVRYGQQIESLGKRMVSLDTETGVLKGASQIEAFKIDYIQGSLAIVSLKKKGLTALLGRAQVLFTNSQGSPLNTEELSAAAVENASRSTATPRRDSQSDSEAESDFEWESEDTDVGL